MASFINRFEIPSLPEIPESERTPLVDTLVTAYEQLAEYCRQQSEQICVQAEQLQLQGEQIQLQAEQIQLLRDEIAILKGEKAKPKIKPSTLEKNDRDKKGKGGKGGGSGKRPGSKKRKKKLEIHEEEIIRPKHIPEGSVFKGYQDYIVQDIEITPKNKKYKLERWQTPNGGYVTGKLPEGVKGYHFGVTLRAYIIKLYHAQRVTEPLILEHLLELGVDISAGQINRIITEGHDGFHAEKEGVLQAGLSASNYINVDDTGARHKGKNGYCTHIDNELFAWFASTESKSRVNFLELLRVGHSDYFVDDVALEYMEGQKLPQAQLELLKPTRVFADKERWEQYLRDIGITAQRHVTIVIEGALLGSVIAHGLSRELVIVSDDAGQFNVLGLLHALCWVHAERTINKIIAYNNANRVILETVQTEIWDFYKELKAYRFAPDDDKKAALNSRFDEIFTQKTGFQTLNLALQRIYNNKQELLLVLERPDIPLHNNLSENDIRSFVTKRKISASTRSDAGRKSRDTFLSLKKTCQKLDISFWQFLKDRLAKNKDIKPLPQLIKLAAQGP